MKKHIYVLGTGTSHDGSACLIKDGRIAVAIEKERVTRLKHDGGNDNAAIDYCLKAEGITIEELDLIVQNSNFGSFKFGSNFIKGERLVRDDLGVPIITISHHLAHAYSTIGTCPFEDEYNILVMDGCGNSYDDCVDVSGSFIPDLSSMNLLPHIYHEKDSYYKYNGECKSLYKDFSEWGYINKGYAMHPGTTKHSIGGMYSAVSVYCFGDMDDPGKLMGLAPYGRPGVFRDEVFELKDDRVFVNYDWMEKYRDPARSYRDFKKNFQYYADIAWMIQQEVERAILYVVKARLNLDYGQNLCYTGGTALNAVANAKIQSLKKIKHLYIEPAAGDNGLALGCAFYGWLEVLKKEKVTHDGSTCFGVRYQQAAIEQTINTYRIPDPVKNKKVIDLFFELLNNSNIDPVDINVVIQLNIADVGVYQILINNFLKCAQEIFCSPTCTVNISGIDFYTAILAPGGLITSYKLGQMHVTNPSDLNWFFQNSIIDSVTASLLKVLQQKYGASRSSVQYRKSPDVIKETAKLLSEGNVIGWFQESSEFGPRALGHRSILADARRLNVNNFINSQIKFREDFRPFAPSVLREEAGLYFKSCEDSPYMILVHEAFQEYRDILRSVVHVNNTSRVQTVTELGNSRYYKLLQEFKVITGFGILLNTSFNKKGMPIVESPHDALNFFFSCQLDYLVMDEFIIEKD